MKGSENDTPFKLEVLGILIVSSVVSFLLTGLAEIIYGALVPGARHTIGEIGTLWILLMCGLGFCFWLWYITRGWDEITK